MDEEEVDRPYTTLLTIQRIHSASPARKCTSTVAWKARADITAWMVICRRPLTQCRSSRRDSFMLLNTRSMAWRLV